MAKQDLPKIPNIIQFLQVDVWRIKANKLSKTRSFFIRQLRIILLAIRGFLEDKCQLRASALTFFSLLSIVPVVAMAFGIAKGFGFEKKLEVQLLDKFQGQEEVIGRVISFAQVFLENTKGGVIAGIGVVILFWTIIKVLGNIENSFNDIWGIKKARTIGRKFSDYLSIMFICPILLIMSSSITVLITSQVELLLQKLSFLGPIAGWIMAGLGILPYCVIWGMFTFIYIFMPNTKVKFQSGLLGGIIAGTIYQIAQWIYIKFQIGAAKYGAIYGSFAALPLFLVWLQTSWLVVLLGAEISFAEQNVETYEFEPDCLKASAAFKKQLSLAITQICIKRFIVGKKPLTSDEISNHLDIPIRLVRQILFELTEVHVLNEVKFSDSQLPGYQPARDIENISIKDVLDMLDSAGIDSIPAHDTAELKLIKEKLASFDNLIKKSEYNVLLKNI